MTETSQKSPHYVLVVDEKSNDVMNLMYNVLCQVPIAKLTFNAALVHFKIPQEAVISFMNDWTEKEHQMGWCKDPKCTWVKKQ